MDAEGKVEVSQEKLPFPLKIESTPDQAYDLLSSFFSDTNALQDFLNKRVASNSETPASLQSFVHGDSFKSLFTKRWNSQRSPLDWPGRTPRVAFTEAAVKATNSMPCKPALRV